MKAEARDKLLVRFKRMFKCDSARIYDGGETLFLIIGRTRNTKDDEGQWMKDGEPVDWDYLAESTIASGRTEAELMESAKEYLKLSKMSRIDGWKYYLRKHGIKMPKGVERHLRRALRIQSSPNPRP